MGCRASWVRGGVCHRRGRTLARVVVFHTTNRHRHNSFQHKANVKVLNVKLLFCSGSTYSTRLTEVLNVKLLLKHVLFFWTYLFYP